ncbi:MULTISPECIES: 50S ribosomal protein L6 [Euryhalocaulis]|uniref:50S ribosomal protein L6 n=1 Tax=Euryhalocaulis TaxID=1712422 RepID=UPI00039D139C|nr:MULTISPECIES: 50S ribosomal protein L6 [Euryhalocaulis]MBA4801235.1 50S ribosomal protein L6 [Euryhalocaulis sp.]
MSRIGKYPVEIPSGVEVTLDGQTVRAKGPKGQLELTLVDSVKAEKGEDGITITPLTPEKGTAMWGLSRSLVDNLVQGVATGFTKDLELVGVGYRAQMRGQSLVLNLGLSHEVVYEPPQGIQITTPKPTEVKVEGADKQAVGQVAAEIRRFRPPEPYKGKGVRYAGEYILRKEGKKK